MYHFGKQGMFLNFG